MHSDPRTEVLNLCHALSLTSEPDGGRITIANRSASFRRTFTTWWATRRYLTRSLRDGMPAGPDPQFFRP
jgi:hypothetical protein